jgi:outer membrane protein assembly factor BamB
MLGHAAPTIDGDRVMVTGAATLLTPSPRELFALPREQLVRLVFSTLFPNRYETHAGQVFLSLHLDDGDIAWQSPLFANPRIAGGHLAGTAVFDGDLGAIILPMSDTLVAFDRATGAIRWTATGMQARGPALVVKGRVIRTGRDGWIRARSLDDGRVLCEERRPRGYDRAGPTLADGLLIFGTLDGYVEALPAERFLTCRGDASGGADAPDDPPPHS